MQPLALRWWRARTGETGGFAISIGSATAAGAYAIARSTTDTGIIGRITGGLITDTRATTAITGLSRPLRPLRLSALLRLPSADRAACRLGYPRHYGYHRPYRVRHGRLLWRRLPPLRRAGGVIAAGTEITNDRARAFGRGSCLTFIAPVRASRAGSASSLPPRRRPAHAAAIRRCGLHLRIPRLTRAIPHRSRAAAPFCPRTLRTPDERRIDRRERRRLVLEFATIRAPVFGPTPGRADGGLVARAIAVARLPGSSAERSERHFGPTPCTVWSSRNHALRIRAEPLESRIMSSRTCVSMASVAASPVDGRFCRVRAEQCTT